MLRIYVDSDIFLNTWFREMHGLDPVFQRAERLFQAIVDCVFFLIVSDLTLEELSRRIPLPISMVKSDYFDQYKRLGKLKVIEVKQDIVDEASRLPTHRADAIHATIAKREKATLVTRNIKHYRKVARIIGLRVRLPEQLI